MLVCLDGDFAQRTERAWDTGNQGTEPLLPGPLILFSGPESFPEVLSGRKRER